MTEKLPKTYKTSAALLCRDILSVFLDYIYETDSRQCCFKLRKLQSRGLVWPQVVCRARHHCAGPVRF